ncbi:hypothetical protein [Salsipaludibacter albus]|uniref:hypothetical protein n=1 Tax=Salsipaludibacter albus TaxID=2849650 RepID=UPI001EE4ABF0|nr:hypothetical protein [Salsipaludibacter albus]MBY5164295.1 hypothetical protein [Salsipaludibacter albus]
MSTPSPDQQRDDPIDRSGAPWWSSDGAGVDPDQDPLAAHLAARNLHAVGDETDDEVGGDVGGGDVGGDVGGDETNDEGAVGDEAHPPGICGVCPICRGHALVQARHPEVAAHLADAARSLSCALATFADLVEAEPAATPDPDDRSTDTFRPIVLDDEEGEAR